MLNVNYWSLVSYPPTYLTPPQGYAPQRTPSGGLPQGSPPSSTSLATSRSVHMSGSHSIVRHVRQLAPTGRSLSDRPGDPPPRHPPPHRRAGEGSSPGRGAGGQGGPTRSPPRGAPSYSKSPQTGQAKGRREGRGQVRPQLRGRQPAGGKRVRLASHICRLFARPNPHHLGLRSQLY